MKNHTLFPSAGRQLAGVLVLAASTVLPLSSAQGAPTLAQYAYPIGDTPTEYGSPTPASAPGAQGPLRSDEISGTKDAGASPSYKDKATGDERQAPSERSPSDSGKRWMGTQPTDYEWFKKTQ